MWTHDSPATRFNRLYLTWIPCIKTESNLEEIKWYLDYRPSTKLLKGNVFSRVYACLCLCVSQGSMWSLSMMHWTSPYSDPSPPPPPPPWHGISLYRNPLSLDMRPPCSWTPGCSTPPPRHVQTCSTWTSLYRDLPRHVETSSLWGTHGWQVTHTKFHNYFVASIKILL